MAIPDIRKGLREDLELISSWDFITSANEVMGNYFCKRSDGQY
jgi:hypothetical protein